MDLQITNNTPYRFAIHLWLDDIHLHGELCCDEDYDYIYSGEERHHRIQQQIWGGYSRHNQLYRICTASDGVETEQLLVENHAIMMYEPLLKAAP